MSKFNVMPQTQKTVHIFHHFIQDRKANECILPREALTADINYASRPKRKPKGILLLVPQKRFHYASHSSKYQFLLRNELKNLGGVVLNSPRAHLLKWRSVWIPTRTHPG